MNLFLNRYLRKTNRTPDRSVGNKDFRRHIGFRNPDGALRRLRSADQYFSLTGNLALGYSAPEISLSKSRGTAETALLNKKRRQRSPRRRMMNDPDAGLTMSRPVDFSCVRSPLEA
jgi:hypothetical protein